tara:strand:- start:549 stop:917 length:369 start_codon:yes stop_codon:yes gene_type:complete
MATFDDSTLGTSTGGTTPDFGAQRKSVFKTRVMQMGDGYEHRVNFGLNQDPKQWSLSWTAKDSSDADKIEAFFEARAGSESFDWTPLDDSTSYKWVCNEWNRTHNYANVNTITATFREVFEP